jgi:histidine triad (HIT) family protein
MQDCVFCQIVTKESSAEVVYEDGRALAFQDHRPAAPVHLLIIPKQHIASINDIQPDIEPIIGHLFTVAAYLAQQEDVDKTGYRLVINNGPDAGQAVFHIHLHLMGGQRLKSLG